MTTITPHAIVWRYLRDTRFNHLRRTVTFDWRTDGRSNRRMDGRTDGRTHDNSIYRRVVKTKNVCQSPACSPIGASAPTKSRGYWTNVYPIFYRRIWVIGGVNAVLPSVVECQRTEWRWGMSILPIRAQNRSVTIETSVERSQKEDRIDHTHLYMYLSWKFCEDQSSTFWDN